MYAEAKNESESAHPTLNDVDGKKRCRTKTVMSLDILAFISRAGSAWLPVFCIARDARCPEIGRRKKSRSDQWRAKREAPALSVNLKVVS